MTEVVTNLAWIDDDYTLDGFIAEADSPSTGGKFWDALEFKYRVATRPECKVLDAQVAKAEREAFSDPKAILKADMFKCEFLAIHVKEWNLKNRGGHEVARTSVNFQKMHDVLFDKLLSIIRGDWMSDPKPGQTESQPNHDEQSKN